VSTTLWIKSRRSGTNGGNCVEVRRHADEIQVRDTKDPGGTILSFTLTEFDYFLQAARDGDFDHLNRRLTAGEEPASSARLAAAPRHQPVSAASAR
jgi:hypothetical protein